MVSVSWTASSIFKPLRGKPKGDRGKLQKLLQDEHSGIVVVFVNGIQFRMIITIYSSSSKTDLCCDTTDWNHGGSASRQAASTATSVEKDTTVTEPTADIHGCRFI